MNRAPAGFPSSCLERGQAPAREPARGARHRTRRRRERGAVLIVALIVLVALGLAALSLLRSVDVLGLVAGNLSFQRSSLNATDVGVDRAMTSFLTVANRTVSPPAGTGCYSATTLASADLNKPAGIPDILVNSATFDAAYPLCRTQSAAGETVRYVVDRQCTRIGLAQSDICILAQRQTTSRDIDSPPDPTIQSPAYRVSVRVDGGRSAASYTQTIFY